MKTLRLFAFGLLASTSAMAQTPAATATTAKPNTFGEQKTVIRDGSGRVTGTATTSKPNSFGEQNTVIRHTSGRVTLNAMQSATNRLSIYAAPKNRLKRKHRSHWLMRPDMEGTQGPYQKI